MDCIDIINKYYIPGSPLYNLLVEHSRQVADRALQIIEQKNLKADKPFTYEAAMLHDIGVYLTHAPSIYCNGTAPYLTHGLIGADILRREGLCRHAHVCETHIGTGLTKQEIIDQKLPLPAQDFLPQTIEEKLVCYADNFFSKSNPSKVKTIDELRLQMAKYGSGTMERLEEMIALFS